MDTVSVVGTIVGSVFGSQVLATLAQGWFLKKKSEAEAHKTDADAASTLVQSMLQWQTTLTTRIATLEQLLKDKDTIIEELRSRISKLEAEVIKIENANSH